MKAHDAEQFAMERDNVFAQLRALTDRSKSNVVGWSAGYDEETDGHPLPNAPRWLSWADPGSVQRLMTWNCDKCGKPLLWLDAVPPVAAQVSSTESVDGRDHVIPVHPGGRAFRALVLAAEFDPEQLAAVRGRAGRRRTRNALGVQIRGWWSSDLSVDSVTCWCPECRSERVFLLDGNGTV